MVLSLKIEPSPIFALLPLLGFAGMGSLDMSHFFVKHPIVKLAKGFFGGSCSVIVRPAANNGVEFPQDFLYLPSSYRFPFLLHLLSVLLDGFLARLSQQLPSSFGVRGSVEPDVKAQEVEALRQVNNVGFL
jgi:hypothetical protein